MGSFRGRLALILGGIFRGTLRIVTIGFKSRRTSRLIVCDILDLHSSPHTIMGPVIWIFRL
jgi:hypothetical protein